MPDEKVILPSIKNAPASTWTELAEKKIFFGHQSVGFNIIDGIKDVMKENPQINIKITETTNPSAFNDPVFAHSRVGENVDPKSKIDSFSDFIRRGIGDKVDIAFFKFCYVDIEKKTDTKDLFEYYRAKMSQLEKDYPGIKFIHVTVPLKTTKTNWKTWIKEKTGKGDMWEYAGNIERNEYNELVRKEYEGRKPVFDLAKIESTYADGTRSSFSSNGKNYYSLAPAYTKDGGHLNEKGRKVVAEQLLMELTEK